MFKFKHRLQSGLGGCLGIMLNSYFARKVMFICFSDIQSAMFSVKNKHDLLMFYTEIAFSLQSFLFDSQKELL